VNVTDEPDDPQLGIDVERRCESGVNSRLRTRSGPPPRFLVLMASSTPLMLADAIWAAYYIAW
jgi:hypothetical protein